jgi:hypothetical protein
MVIVVVSELLLARGYSDDAVRAIIISRHTPIAHLSVNL